MEIRKSWYLRAAQYLLEEVIQCLVSLGALLAAPPAPHAPAVNHWGTWRLPEADGLGRLATCEPFPG